MSESHWPQSTSILLLLAAGCSTEKGSEEESGRHETASTETGEPAPTGCAPPDEGYVTDTEVHDPPEPPALAAAGDTALDPTFGTTILRVTDADDDAAGCLHSYAYWPTLNTDSSRLVLYCYDAGLVLYDFDPETLDLSKRGVLFPSNPEGGTSLSWEDVFWSGSDPDLLFAHDGTRLYTFDVSTSTFALVHEFSELLGSSRTLKQMSRSEDDDVFAWHFQDTSTVSQGYVVYRRSTDEILASGSDMAIDEVQVDKGGDFLLIKTGKQGDGAVEVQVLDLATGVVEDLVDNDPDYAPGHSDNGHGFVVGHDNWSNRVTRRGLATPHDVTTILEFGSDWSFDYHVSLRAKDEDWALLSLYSYTGATSGLFHEELLQVATDGSGAVRRLAHHQTRYADYWSSPRAVMSADGCFVTFTSTWGDSGRTDVFIAAL